MIRRSTEFLGGVNVDTGDTPSQPEGTKAIGYQEASSSAAVNRPLASLAKAIDHLDWVCFQEWADFHIVELDAASLTNAYGYSHIEVATALPADRQRIYHGRDSSVAGLRKLFRIFGEDGFPLIGDDGTQVGVVAVDSTVSFGVSGGLSVVDNWLTINSHSNEPINGFHLKHGIIVPKSLADDAESGDLAVIAGGTLNDGTYTIRRVVAVDASFSILELMTRTSYPVLDDVAAEPLVLDNTVTGGDVTLRRNGAVSKSPVVRLNGIVTEQHAYPNGKVYIELPIATPMPRHVKLSSLEKIPEPADRKIQGYARSDIGYATEADPSGLSLFPYPYKGPAGTQHIRRSWGYSVNGFRNLFSLGVPTWEMDSALYLRAYDANPTCAVALPTRIPPGSVISGVNVPLYNGTAAPLGVSVGLLREMPHLPGVDVPTIGNQDPTKPTHYTITSSTPLSHSGVSGVEFITLTLPTLSGNPMFYTGSTLSVTDDGSNRYTIKVAGWYAAAAAGIYPHGLSVNDLTGLTVPFMGDYLYIANGVSKGIYPIIDMELSSPNLDLQILSAEAIDNFPVTVGIPAIIGPNTDVSVYVDPGLPASLAQLRLYPGMVTTLSPNDALAAGFPY